MYEVLHSQEGRKVNGGGARQGKEEREKTREGGDRKSRERERKERAPVHHDSGSEWERRF